MDKKKIVFSTVLNEAFYKSRFELIKNFIDKGYEIILIGPEPELYEKGKFINTSYYPVRLERTGTSLIKDFIYLKDVYNVMRIEKPAIVYSFGGAKAVIYTSIAAKITHVNGIFSMVNGLGSIFRGKGTKNFIIKLIMKFLFKFSLKTCDGVLFQNKDDLEIFAKQNLVSTSKTIIVNGSGVNMDRFPLTELPNKKVFLFVGRLLRDKGIYEFIEAAKTIKSKYRDVEFWVVGGFDSNPTSINKDKLQEAIDNKTITYFGKQENILSFYQDASVFVLPSYHEGTPRTSLEAMAVGRPIITTDAPGCRETVIDGRNGFLVSVRNHKELSDKIEFFILNPEKIVQMGIESHEIAKQKYEVNKVNASIISMLKSKTKLERN